MTILAKKIVGLFLVFAYSMSTQAFELLSEGAMGSVSAVSANSADEIISVAGSSAAGLRVDGDYESLPFQTSVRVEDYAKDDASEELNFALTREVDSWAQTLKQNVGSTPAAENLEIGYIDELPASSFQENAFVVRDEEFDRLILEPESMLERRQDKGIYDLGRIEQVVTQLRQNADSVEYVVRREMDFIANINASVSNNAPSIGSTYISNITGVSNVKISSVRD